MKLKNILRNVTAMALPLALLGSCTGDFEELNTNPYEIDPEELPFEAQFSTPLSFSYPTHQNLFQYWTCLLYTSPSPRDRSVSRMPSSA